MGLVETLVGFGSSAGDWLRPFLSGVLKRNTFIRNLCAAKLQGCHELKEVVFFRRLFEQLPSSSGRSGRFLRARLMLFFQDSSIRNRCRFGTLRIWSPQWTPCHWLGSSLARFGFRKKTYRGRHGRRAKGWTKGFGISLLLLVRWMFHSIVGDVR